MILKRLAELGDRIPKAPPGYMFVRVAWSVDMDDNGRLLDVRKLVDDSGKKERPALMSAPNIGRSGNVTAKLVVDKGTYALGLPTEKHAEEKTKERHNAFKALIKEAAEDTGLPDMKAILKYLEGESRPELPEGVTAEQNVTFTVNGRDVANDPLVIDFWGRYTGDKVGSANDDDTKMGQCLICGETKPVLQRLEYKIKGLPGGQPSGTQIVCADKAAFESYGMKNSHNSPTCRECGEKFTKAVNYLIANPATHRFVKDAGKVKGVLLFWTETGEEGTLDAFLGSPAESEAGEHFSEMIEGTYPAGMDDFPVYILYLKANGGRAAVGLWEETTKQEVDRRTERWLTRQAILGEWGDVKDPMPIVRYYDGTRYRAGILDSILPLKGRKSSRIRNYDKVDGYITEAVISAVLQDRPLPASLLTKAVLRCAIEGGVTRGQASLIKMMICKSREEDELMVGLDKTNMDAGYLCGRIMCIIENIQRATTIQKGTATAGDTAPEKFFGAASQSPMRIFPRLLQITQQGYLPKLRRKSPGAYTVLSRELEEVHQLIGGDYPRILTMGERGRFMLGYYHQKAAMAADRRERFEKNAAAEENGEATQGKTKSKKQDK